MREKLSTPSMKYYFNAWSFSRQCEKIQIERTEFINIVHEEEDINTAIIFSRLSSQCMVIFLARQVCFRGSTLAE